MKRVFLSALLCCPSLCGQTPVPTYAFEVAAVKALGDEPIGIKKKTQVLPPIAGDRLHLTYDGVTLLGVLSEAYGVGTGSIKAPEWMGQMRFRIDARVPDDAPKGHVPEMLQNLLAERFAMAVHQETREERGFALTVSSQGPKLQATETNSAGVPVRRRISPDAKGMGKGVLKWRAVTMDEFADSLSTCIGRPVVNKTGINGAFDIVLNAAADAMPGPAKHASRVDSDLPSIFSAIHDLGLNLQSQKVTVRRLVVDSAERVPREN